MKQALHIFAKEIDELEDYVSGFYAPVKMDKAEHIPDKSGYGAMGEICSFGEVSFEWVQTTGNFKITPLTDYDSIFFKFCKTGGAVFESRSGTYAHSPNTAISFSRPKSLIISEGSFATVCIGRELLSRRLSALIGRAVVPNLSFTERPTVGYGRFGALMRFVNEWQASSLLSHGETFPELSESFAEIVADSFLLAYPNNYSEFLAQPSKASISPKHVKRALDYMRGNPKARCSPKTLADLSAVSIRSLQYAFRATTGQTISEYKLGLRLTHAREQLLSSPESPLSVIAIEWGFGSPGSFSQAFKCAYGETPSACRRRYKIHSVE